MIKLIAIDLDGTLLDDNKNISLENKEAIRKCKEQGIKVVIATGRPINGVLPILRELSLTSNDDYVITYNGAKVFNVGTKHNIFTSTVDGNACMAIYNESRRLGLHYHAFRENEELITVDHNPYTDIEARINGVIDHVYDFSLIKPQDKFIKIMLVDSKENIDAAIPRVLDEYKKKFTMVRSSDIFLEFLNPNTSKGLALEVLCKHLGIKRDEAMAIGDAGNDLPMILKAGIGVAMENSSADVKLKADYITESNLNSGVAKAIEKFALK